MDLVRQRRCPFVIEIADDTSRDWKMRLVGGIWRWTVDHEHIERARLRCDTLRWLMARLAPKKYGKRLGVEANGMALFRANKFHFRANEN